MSAAAAGWGVTQQGRELGGVKGVGHVPLLGFQPARVLAVGQHAHHVQRLGPLLRIPLCIPNRSAGCAHSLTEVFQVYIMAGKVADGCMLTQKNRWKTSWLTNLQWAAC